MKKLLLLIPVIALLATSCGSSQQASVQTEPTSTPAPTQQVAQTPAPTTATSSPAQIQTDQTANWKIYTSSTLGLTFKYPSYWGKPVEELRDSSGVTCKPQDDLCNSTKGKQDNISFSNPNSNTKTVNKYPFVQAVSPDFTLYEGSAYTGKVTPQAYYNSITTAYNPALITSGQFVSLGNVRGFTYVTASVDGLGTFWGIETIAQINTKGFSGLAVGEDLNPYDYNNPNYVNPTDAELKKFITDYNNGTLDASSKKKINDYNLFLNTFKFK